MKSGVEVRQPNARNEPRRARSVDLSHDDTRAVGSIALLGGTTHDHERMLAPALVGREPRQRELGLGRQLSLDFTQVRQGFGIARGVRSRRRFD